MSLTLQASEILADLLEGNRRFRSGCSVHHCYEEPGLRELALGQAPVAAVIACSDSRVVPEVIFDQPLGSLFVSRVPGNVASDGTKWMIEIAMSAYKIPLVIVLGHTGCLAVSSVLGTFPGTEGGLLRFKVMAAVDRAKGIPGGDRLRVAVEENARESLRELSTESYLLRNALADGATSGISMVYDMETGQVIQL